ncbi:uncharacterized protein LOC108161739 [Drosophila miranda]|uniref:uncharacterized protein LOC108161739 n=1 Tax=Drosophila miranda TaxID=7229 RepID=UPI0007E7BC88|nr:uncharacterized protein LOC108161739 [Drosophila miranda]
MLKLVAERLTKNCIRTSIPPDCRLFLTLRYLASGEGTGRLAKSFKMGHSTVRGIIQETSDVLWTLLSPTFLSQPKKGLIFNRFDWHDEFGSQLFGDHMLAEMGPGNEENATYGYAFIASSAFPARWLRCGKRDQQIISSAIQIPLRI